MDRRLALYIMAAAWWLAAGSAAPVDAADGGEAVGSRAPSSSGAFHWESLPSIPDAHGFAGSFVGVHDDVLLVAGGANFPAGAPWEGGVKVWHDAAFALRRGGASWQPAGALARPLGYGVSLTTPWGIACLGGSDSQRHFTDCFLMKSSKQGVTFDPLPPLPRPCANACGAMLGSVLYVAGGAEKPDATTALRTLWSLDLARPTDGWRELEPFPGEGRMLATMGAQGGAIYLFGGVALAPGADGAAERQWLRDAFMFRPGQGWTKRANLPHNVAAAPSPAPASGQSHLLLIGGDDGAQVDSLPADHKGFPRQILAYHTITDTWTELGDLPIGLVTTPTAIWNDRIVIAGGEQRPGVRSTEVWSGKFASRKRPFGWLNYMALSGYLAGMGLIGWVCAARNKNADDYFKASGRIPWWAAGMSIYATMLSSLTFMAVPATAYASNWCFALSYISLILLAPVIIRVYLPFFRGLNVTSAYEYLELRFNLLIRLFGSASFIAFQIGRTGIVLYLPALALSTVGDIDMQWCIVGMAMLSIALTVFGGMEAVIWTDVAQTALLLGAVLVSLVFLVFHIDGGLAGLITTGHANGKFFESVSWSTDLTLTTGWVALIGLGFNSLISYTSNQEVVQRYLTTQDEKLAGRAIWTNALLSVPSGILFFGVGTALFAFYRQFPNRLDPTIQNDAIFPLFILQELPVGIAGLVVAGIFAAAQPTSGLNSTAAAVVTDFYRRLKSEVGEREAVIAGRVATVCTGLLGMSVALLAAEMNIRSIWELFLSVLGVTTGLLAGIFALGMLTTRANAAGAMLGLAAAAATMILVSMLTHLHPLWYGAVGVTTSLGFGYLLSHFFPVAPTDGLTIHSMRSRKLSSDPGSVALLAQS